MKLTDLESIYKANIDTGPLEAMEAVYLHGYYDGAGTTITATTATIGVLASRPAPTVLLKIKKPDLR